MSFTVAVALLVFATGLLLLAFRFAAPSRVLAAPFFAGALRGFVGMPLRSPPVWGRSVVGRLRPSLLAWQALLTIDFDVKWCAECQRDTLSVDACNVNPNHCFADHQSHTLACLARQSQAWCSACVSLSLPAHCQFLS